MDVVIPNLLAVLYVVVGAASIAPFARYFRQADKEKRRLNRYHDVDSPAHHGFLGWCASLVWPVTGLIFGVAWAITKDERAEVAAKERAATLDGAQELVRKEAARRRRELDKQRSDERLREQRDKHEFDLLLAELEGKPAPRPSWQDHVRRKAKAEGLYPYDKGR